MSTPKKVFILGLDGGTFDIILPLVEKGDLPHISQLLQRGAWGRLESTIHPSTPIAWTSFMTGLNPGKHGIYDFIIAKDNDYGFKLSTAADRFESTMWDYMGGFDKKTVVVNVPYTYPPDKINGIMISGLDAPMSRRDIATPPEIYDDLVNEFGEYIMDWTFPTGWRYDLKAYREKLFKTIKFRVESGLYLFKKYPWDCFTIVFNPIDHVQHIFWDAGEEGKEIICGAYRQFDHCLGEFLRVLDDDTVILMMSDHGAGAIDRVFYMDTWLKSEGYLKYNDAALKSRSLFLNLGKKGRTFLRRNLPISAKKLLRYLMPGLREKVESSLATLNVDWSKVTAYSAGYYGNIFINLKGVKPMGTVEPADYDALCEEIANKLYALKDPDTGDMVVERVYRKHEIYTGPYLKYAPDIIIKWKDYSTYTEKGIENEEDSQIFGRNAKAESSDYPLTGTHRLNGIFIAAGPGIKQAGEVTHLRIYDLFPTILYIMGLPVPDDRDGRIITEIFDEEFSSRNPPKYTSIKTGSEKNRGEAVLTSEQEESVAERLRSLGYIE